MRSNVRAGASVGRSRTNLQQLVRGLALREQLSARRSGAQWPAVQRDEQEPEQQSARGDRLRAPGLAEHEDQGGEPEQHPGHGHRGSRAERRHEPVRRSERAPRGCRACRHPTSFRPPAPTGTPLTVSAVTSKGPSMPISTKGGPKSSAVATRDPRTIPPIAASSGRSPGSSHWPSGRARNGQNREQCAGSEQGAIQRARGRVTTGQNAAERRAAGERGEDHADDVRPGRRRCRRTTAPADEPRSAPPP